MMHKAGETLSQVKDKAEDITEDTASYLSKKFDDVKRAHQR